MAVVVVAAAAAAAARSAKTKKKKKNLGSDLNLASTGVWPCRKDSCACDVRRPCVRYWLPSRHPCHRGSAVRNPAISRFLGVASWSPCVGRLRSVLCVRCSDVRYSRPAVSKIESVRPLVVEPLCLCDVHAGRRRAPLLGLLARCGALDETGCWSRPLFSHSSGL